MFVQAVGRCSPSALIVICKFILRRCGVRCSVYCDRSQVSTDLVMFPYTCCVDNACSFGHFLCYILYTRTNFVVFLCVVDLARRAVPSRAMNWLTLWRS